MVQIDLDRPGILTSVRSPKDTFQCAPFFKPNCHLVEPPLNYPAAISQRPEEFNKHLLSAIQIVARAARALVANLSRNGLAVGAHTDSLAAVRIAVGLRAHELGRNRNDIVSVVLARVVPAAGAKANLEVGQIARDGTAAAGARVRPAAGVAAIVGLRRRSLGLGSGNDNDGGSRGRRRSRNLRAEMLLV